MLYVCIRSPFCRLIDSEYSPKYSSLCSRNKSLHYSFYLPRWQPVRYLFWWCVFLRGHGYTPGDIPAGDYTLPSRIGSVVWVRASFQNIPRLAGRLTSGPWRILLHLHHLPHTRQSLRRRRLYQHRRETTEKAGSHLQKVGFQRRQCKLFPEFATILHYILGIW